MNKSKYEDHRHHRFVPFTVHQAGMFFLGVNRLTASGSEALSLQSDEACREAFGRGGRLDGITCAEASRLQRVHFHEFGSLESGLLVEASGSLLVVLIG